MTMYTVISTYNDGHAARNRYYLMTSSIVDGQMRAQLWFLAQTNTPGVARRQRALRGCDIIQQRVFIER